MPYDDQTTIYGSNVSAIFKRGYEKGRREQLEQDMAMIQDILLKVENYEDFSSLLREELERIGGIDLP